MIKNKISYTLLALWGLVIAISCEQSEPVFNNRDGDVLTFAGRKWDIKFGDQLFGPGPNFFSNHPNDVWVDEKGYLHLTITERDSVWKATEVICHDNTGYGTYIFTIEGNPVDIDSVVVLGLFTWDNTTFQEQANSEVDIEFSYFNRRDAFTALQYAVQPTDFGIEYPDRKYRPDVPNNAWVGVSTHAFTWTDTLITWESWPGSEYGNGDPIGYWTFDLSNDSVSKFENGIWSDSLIIPAPGPTTNARMNFWLLNGQAPKSGLRHEMVIRNFEYIPLQ